MRLRPVKRYPGPAFPTRDVLDTHPELLRLLPKRWQRNALVVGSVAVVLTLVFALRRTQPPGVHVAPVFNHGAGYYRGSWGCVAVSPPIFLSEDEAQHIIRDEAATMGVRFESTTDELAKLPLPRPNPYGFISIEEGQRGLALDGKDATRPIWFEYVSREDYYTWTVEPIVSPRMLSGSTAGTYDYKLRSTAHGLRNALVGQKPTGAYGVFYDPVAEETPSSHPIIVSKGMTYVPEDVLSKVLPSFRGVTDEEREAWEARVQSEEGLNDLMERSHFYRYMTFLSLKDFCTEQGWEYRWDPANRQATATDPRTGRCHLFSVGGPVASKDALRAQVRDFLQWLKAEGVI